MSYLFKRDLPLPRSQLKEPIVSHLVVLLNGLTTSKMFSGADKVLTRPDEVAYRKALTPTVHDTAFNEKFPLEGIGWICLRNPKFKQY